MNGPLCDFCPVPRKPATRTVPYGCDDRFVCEEHAPRAEAPVAVPCPVTLARGRAA
jgi:hypothetical protein